MIDIELLPGKGLCDTCDDRSDCPMAEMLPRHRENQRMWGEFYGDDHPLLWVEDAIDEPEHDGNVITWCPMYYEKSNSTNK